MHKDNDNPIVSIIIPVFNTQEDLPSCLESITKQTYTDFEIILIDDGSTDNSPQICDEYATKHSNTKVIHQINQGLSKARFTGFQRAIGRYLLFADSDDYIHPKMLEKMVDSLEKTDADLSFCAYSVKRENEERAIYLPYQATLLSGREQIVEEYIKPLIGKQKQGKRIPGFLWLRMMKRSLIKPIYFQPENEYYMEDHVFDLLYADHVKTIAIINEPLYTYCVREGSLSNRYRPGKLHMLQRLFQFYEKYLLDRNITNYQEQLDSYVAFAFFEAVDNAALSGNYRSYRKEICELSEADLDAIRHPNFTSASSSMQKLIVSLYRFHLYLALFIVRRQRLTQR